MSAFDPGDRVPGVPEHGAARHRRPGRPAAHRAAHLPVQPGRRSTSAASTSPTPRSESDARANPQATFLVDDFSPTAAHAVEVRGDAEIHETGGEAINPRFPTSCPSSSASTHNVVSWGLEEGTGLTGDGFRASAPWAERRGPARHAALDRRSAGVRRPGPRRGAGPGPRHGPLRPQRRQPPGLAGGRRARRGRGAGCGTCTSTAGTTTWPSRWRA